MSTLRLTPALLHHHPRRRRSPAVAAAARRIAAAPGAVCATGFSVPRRRWCPVTALSGVAHAAISELAGEELLFEEKFLLKRSQAVSKAGSSGNSRCLGFPLICLRSGLYKNHQRIKFQVEVKASSGGNVLGDEMASVPPVKHDFGVVDIHHVGVLCENLEKSLEFYQNLLGLEINEARPHHKLPYRGAWLWVGSGMIHLMELPNPDPLSGRPEHGGRDRHTCISIRDVSELKTIFDDAGINYTLSKSGRPAIFARDPDGNALEFTQVE